MPSLTLSPPGTTRVRVCLSCKSFSALPNAHAVSSLELVIAVYSHRNFINVYYQHSRHSEKMPLDNTVTHKFNEEFYYYNQACDNTLQRPSTITGLVG